MGTNRTPKGFGSSSGKERKSRRVSFPAISPPTRNRDLITSAQTMAFAEIRILLNLKNNVDGKQKTNLMKSHCTNMIILECNSLKMRKTQLKRTKRVQLENVSKMEYNMQLNNMTFNHFKKNT